MSRNASLTHAPGSLLPSAQPSRQAALDRQTGASSSAKSFVQQPKPQALPKRSGPASILVSPRQKGNPVLDKIKQMPWEYDDKIPSDYVLGATTCALFLSLKYHRLHPEYIYTRIKNLQGKYALRIILCMVDIQNHEQSLKELSKTSIINNVTIILCWSAAEGARYLELFKTYENAAPTAIKQHQSTTYSDRMVEFITTPRSINKTDAVSLVSQFGTIRTAVNARHEEVAMIAGWGEKKVQQWCKSVSEPFRIQRASKRGLNLENLVASQPLAHPPALSHDAIRVEPGSIAEIPTLERSKSRMEEEFTTADAFADDEEALLEATALPASTEATSNQAQEGSKKRKIDDDLSDGVMAALSKLRKT
jgi:DNA excision repair protein ERCC-1